MNDRPSEEEKPIVPMKCPRCGRKVIFEPNDKYRCESCGELYYDHWLGIWRISVPPEEWI